MSMQKLVNIKQQSWEESCPLQIHDWKPNPRYLWINIVRKQAKWGCNALMRASWIRMGPRSNRLMSLGKERFSACTQGYHHISMKTEKKSCIYEPQDAKCYLKPPETRKSPRMDSPSQPSEEIHCVNLDHRLPALSTIDNNCLLFKI